MHVVLTNLCSISSILKKVIANNYPKVLFLDPKNRGNVVGGMGANWHGSRVDMKGLFRSTLVLIHTALLSNLKHLFSGFVRGNLAWKSI